MAKQLLLNRGFENELEGYIIQGSVSTNDDIAYSGIKSAQLIANPTSIAEISQVVYFITPSSPLRFSFYARGFINEEVESASNIRAEVNFINVQGSVTPPGIAVMIRGRDISEQTWNYYEGYAETPFFAVAAQIVIRLEPPESGSSGLLVDDLALVADTTPPVSAAAFMPQATSPFPGLPFVPTPTVPTPQAAPTFPGWPFAPPPATAVPVPQAMAGLTNLLFPGFPYANLTPEDSVATETETQNETQAQGSTVEDPGDNEK